MKEFSEQEEASFRVWWRDNAPALTIAAARAAWTRTQENATQAKDVQKKKKSTWHVVANPQKDGMTYKLKHMEPGAEWWEVRGDEGPKPTSRERALYVNAKRADVLIEITRHRALSMTSDTVTHLIRVRKICNMMEA